MLDQLPAVSTSRSGARTDIEPPDADALIAELAARQQGVVARAQLIQAGVPRHRIEYRLMKTRLRPLHRGVYRVGPVIAPFEREMAAVLACGPAAMISYRAAAAVWRLLYDERRTAPVDVSIPGGCRRPGPGVRVHRVAALPADECTVLHGLPITTPARTLLDLAGCVGAQELERAFAVAERERLASGEVIERLLERYPRRSGTGKLRALMAGEARPALTRSEAETRFLALIRKAQLRGPEANVVVRGLEVDFYWRAERLIVEMDGFAFHSSRDAFERDRRRDAVLTAAGVRVMRVTWRQISTEPEALLVRVAQALAYTRGE